METFKTHVTRSNSVIAAHAMIRALANRKSLRKRADLLAYLAVVSGERADAIDIALRGMDIVAKAHRGNLATVGEEEASSYIKWLSSFALARAARGRVPNPDRGKTLLFELRKTVTS
jgi:hypothetical protein